MFKYFIAKNYRCFSSIMLDKLERVNVIAGMNNTGKTSLLEALYLHSYPQNCTLPFEVNELRGVDTERRYDESFATWLFNGGHAKSGLELISFDEKGVQRTLQMAYGDAASMSGQFPQADKIVQGSFLEGDWKTDRPRIVLRSEEGGKEFICVGLVQWNGLLSMSSQTPWDGPAVFLSSWKHAPDEDVKAFSELELANRQREILPSLQIIEPRLKRLSLVLAAGKPVLHADLGFTHLVPIVVLGEGIRRLLSILSAIATAANGKVLIDEIENGLHYSVHKKVWLAIADAARRANAQIFATTHSWECIQAAHDAFKERGPYEFRYYRLDRRGNEITAKTFDERQLDTVEKSDLEVR